MPEFLMIAVFLGGVLGGVVLAFLLQATVATKAAMALSARLDAPGADFRVGMRVEHDSSTETARRASNDPVYGAPVELVSSPDAVEGPSTSLEPPTPRAGSHWAGDPWAAIRDPGNGRSGSKTADPATKRRSCGFCERVRRALRRGP